MNAIIEMPKYECHKKVWALKIAGIVGDQHGMVYFQPAEEGYDKVPLTPEYVAKHRPEVGGYYVVYADGYKSYSPAKAFEDGYTKVGAQEEAPKEQQESFKHAAMPLIKWLCENVHPRHRVIVTHTNAELLEGQRTTGDVLEFLRD